MGVGRKPKPTQLKVLAGNPGKRPLNQNEATPDALEEVPPAPEHLSDDAKVEWERIVPRLMKSRLLTEIDTAAIAAYCQVYGRWVAAERDLKTRGQFLTSKDGNVYHNPSLSIANKALDQMRKFMTEFGMTPSSRSRVSVVAVKKSKPSFLELINGKD